MYQHPTLSAHGWPLQEEKDIDRCEICKGPMEPKEERLSFMQDYQMACRSCLRAIDIFERIFAMYQHKNRPV